MMTMMTAMASDVGEKSTPASSHSYPLTRTTAASLLIIITITKLPAARRRRKRRRRRSRLHVCVKTCTFRCTQTLTGMIAYMYACMYGLLVLFVYIEACVARTTVVIIAVLNIAISEGRSCYEYCRVIVDAAVLEPFAGSLPKLQIPATTPRPRDRRSGDGTGLHPSRRSRKTRPPRPARKDL